MHLTILVMSIHFKARVETPSCKMENLILPFHRIQECIMNTGFKPLIQPTRASCSPFLSLFL